MTPHRSFALILLLALVVRVAAACAFQAHFGARFVFGDSDGYWTLGRAIAEGKPYQYGEDRVFRTPGYPLVLAPLFLLCGGRPPILAARMLSAVLGTLAVAAVGWLARTLFDARCARVAALLAAIYPGAVALSVVVLSEAAFCPLAVAQLAAWATACRAHSTAGRIRWAIAAGLLAGAATLVRPSWLLFTPLALASTLLAGPRRWQLLGTGALVLAGMIAMLTPWWIRNAKVAGHFIPTTLQVGASLYDGWNPQASGGSEMRFVAAFRDSERQKLKTDGGDDSLEFRLDRRLRQEAVTWAWKDPSRVAQLAWIKLLRLWNVWPNEPAFSAWPARLVVVFAFLPAVFLGIIGARRTSRWGWPYTVCWLPAVYVSLLHMVFVSSLRYREPAMLPLLVLAAAVICGLTTKEGCGLSSRASSTSAGSSSSGESFSAR